MESSEQNFSIDHFEEKVVSYSPVLERADEEEANSSETAGNEGEGGASQKASIEMESGVNKTDEVLPLEKCEVNTLTNEIDGFEAVSKEKVEILMGANVESDISMRVGGRPADKEQILNVSVGIKQIEEDMEYPAPVFKSEVCIPSDPIDIEAPQTTELDSKYEASTTVFMKNPDNAKPIQKEQVSLSGSAVLQSQPIEVERKFQVTNFDEKKLFEAEGKLVSEVTFEDIYYDNNSYDLILSDCWLRQRNQKWEFKVPVNRNPNLLYMSTQFHELEGEKDIKTALIDIIKPEADSSENQGIIEEFKLKPFATFTSTRKSYKLPSDCTVVIDVTGFGYSVGEIELMVKDNSDIGEAINKIDTIAGQLGFQMLSITELANC